MPKKTYPENIQKLKDQLETGNNLVDYFFVCGVPPKICQNEELYNISDDNYLDNVKNILKPTILSKFPEFDNNNDTIDEEIISYCFPEGFEVLLNTSSDPKRRIFSIILDNNLFSSEYPQKYLTCILFYEKLSQYKKLQRQIEKIDKNKDNLDNLNLDDTLINSIRSSLKDERNANVYRHNKILTSILPSINIDDHVIEDPNIGNLDIGQMRNTLNQPIAKLKYYYIPKCICLVSIHPYVKLYQKILSNIYSYGCSVSNEIPLEKIITNLIIEVPIPPRGLYSINYNYSFNFNEKSNQNTSLSSSRAQSQFLIQVGTMQNGPQILPLQSTENNKLLVSEIDLKKFNRILSFVCKMETIKHILLGSKILFFSTNLNNLSDIILSFLCLIFPFKYPFQVSSLLHKSNYRIIESISPFIIGINEEYSEQFFDKNDITLEGMNVLVVDLDKKDGKNYYLFTDEEFPEFPNKLMTTLEKEIKSIENSSNNIINDNNNKEKIIKDFNEQYQEKFFHFFCEILKGYEDYLNMDFFKSSDSDNVTSIETLFKCDEFIKNHSQNDILFYTKFINDSQLFADFIYKRMIPRNNNELMDILIVNDYLASKKKTKSKGKDSDQNEYKINNKYIVPRPRELADEEITQILSQIVELSEKGQIVKKLLPDPKKNNNTNNNNNNNIVFDYTLFPVLDFNIYCNNENVNQYIPPPDYSEEIDAINSDVISKSSLGQNMNRKLEMKNYLYLTWLEIWAFTFWYNEPGEKHYRFDLMLDVLDKVIHHEMNILNLMFDVLNKHGEPQMMLKLYQKLLQLKINPSTFIYDIMSNVLDKKQIKNLFDEMKKNSSKQQLKFKDYNIKNNRERTFLSINDNLPLETKPRFYYDYSCIYCTEKINLCLTCKNFEGIRNDIIWVKCKNCGEYNLPKITVKFGLDFVPTQSKSTSIEDFVLHSPYNLKINIKNAVVSRYGMDINISDFKSQFQAIFWNFIWYCVIHNLDYNILLPYSKNLEQLKETLFYNPNREIFEVSYDDNVFIENENKIERISVRIKEKNNEIKTKTKFENLITNNNVTTVDIAGVKEEINEFNDSFEVKDDVIENNDNENTNDLETFMNMGSNKLFEDLEGLEEEKEDEKEDEKKEDEKDKE